jgi:hypothetical protein
MNILMMSFLLFAWSGAGGGASERPRGRRGLVLVKTFMVSSWFSPLIFGSLVLTVAMLFSGHQRLGILPTVPVSFSGFLQL